jgi:hypothetical protein
LDEHVSPKPSTFPSVPTPQEISNLGMVALKHYKKAKDYLRQGNWAKYGEELENLEKILQELSKEGKVK